MTSPTRGWPDIADTSHEAVDAWLQGQQAEARVRWALDRLPGPHVVSTSFGAQSAVMLHLATRVRPDIPVIFIDTGYLFEETHVFCAALTARLGLRLKVYRPDPRRAWSQRDVAELASAGVDGIQAYNEVHKVEPMQRALRELAARTWIAGPRRQQSRSRSALRFIEARGDLTKLHPLADWSDRDIGRYLSLHGLPYHPLWSQGYVSIGDTHSTRPLTEGMDVEDSRFFGLKRECGLHEDWTI